MEIAHVSSYPPTKCGIASFTAALINSWEQHFPHSQHHVWAVDDGSSGIPYGPKVAGRIEADSLQSFSAAADQVSRRSYSAVVVQHEYRLFGGRDGDYILALLRNLAMPVVLVIHMVYAEPTEHQLYVTQSMAELASSIVVQTASAREVLTKAPYEIEGGKIWSIPHGVSRRRHEVDRRGMREHLNFSRKSILLTCGLLRRDKGIEFVLHALPLIIQRDPTIQLLIVGETHPGVARREGEQYRAELELLIHSLGIRKHVDFVKEFVPIEQMENLFLASDIYVAPYTSNQTSSGTVAQAILHGLPVIASGFPYAREVLADGSGILVNFNDPSQVAAAVLKVLEDPIYRQQARERSKEKSLLWSWDKVAEQYYALIAPTKAP